MLYIKHYTIPLCILGIVADFYSSTDVLFSKLTFLLLLCVPSVCQPVWIRPDYLARVRLDFFHWLIYGIFFFSDLGSGGGGGGGGEGGEKKVD